MKVSDGIIYIECINGEIYPTSPDKIIRIIGGSGDFKNRVTFMVDNASRGIRPICDGKDNVDTAAKKLHAGNADIFDFDAGGTRIIIPKRNLGRNTDVARLIYSGLPESQQRAPSKKIKSLMLKSFGGTVALIRNGALSHDEIVSQIKRLARKSRTSELEQIINWLWVKSITEGEDSYLSPLDVFLDIADRRPEAFRTQLLAATTVLRPEQLHECHNRLIKHACINLIKTKPDMSLYSSLNLDDSRMLKLIGMSKQEAFRFMRDGAIRSKNTSLLALMMNFTHLREIFPDDQIIASVRKVIAEYGTAEECSVAIMQLHPFSLAQPLDRQAIDMTIDMAEKMAMSADITDGKKIGVFTFVSISTFGGVPEEESALERHVLRRLCKISRALACQITTHQDMAKLLTSMHAIIKSSSYFALLKRYLDTAGFSDIINLIKHGIMPESNGLCNSRLRLFDYSEMVRLCDKARQMTADALFRRIRNGDYDMAMLLNCGPEIFGDPEFRAAALEAAEASKNKNYLKKIFGKGKHKWRLDEFNK